MEYGSRRDGEDLGEEEIMKSEFIDLWAGVYGILNDYLEREELWSKEDWKKYSLIEADLNILKTNKILVGQCYELYKLLGGDENEALKDIETNNNDEEENEDNDENFEENINLKKKKMDY